MSPSGHRQAAGGESAAKHVAGAGAVDAVDLERGVRISRPLHQARLPASPSVTQTTDAPESRPIDLERAARGPRGR